MLMVRNCLITEWRKCFYNTDLVLAAILRVAALIGLVLTIHYFHELDIFSPLSM